MTAQIDHVLRYDGATIREVHDMLADPAFREKVCVLQGDLRHVVRIERDQDQMVVEVDRVQPATGVPSVAKSYVGDEIQIVQRESWSSPAKADVTITIPGKPAQITGTMLLSEVRGGVEQHVRLAVKVGIPLLGRKLEGMISQLLTYAMKAENHAGKEWLAESR